MRRHLAKLKLLEKRGGRASFNRTLLYTPPKTADEVLRSVGKPGRWLLVPSWSTDAAYERALRKQQSALIGNAKANTKPIPPQLPVGRFVDDKRAPNIALILRGR